MACNPDYFFRYFDLRGRGEPIRWLLKVCGAKYNEERIPFNDWPPKKCEFVWGVTPVLEVDGIQLHQTMSISRYLANQFKLTPTDSFDQARLDEVAESVHELTESLGDALDARLMKENDKVSELLLKCKDKSLKILSIVEKTVTNEGWIHSKVMTWCDVVIACYLDLFETYLPDLLQPTPKLQNILKKVRVHPAIHSWINSRKELEPYEAKFK